MFLLFVDLYFQLNLMQVDLGTTSDLGESAVGYSSLTSYTNIRNMPEVREDPDVHTLLLMVHQVGI